MRVSQSPPRTAAAALAAAGLLLVAFDGSAATGPRILQKSTPGEIEALAMDGSRIAYDVSAEYSPKRCNTVYIWNAARGTTTRVSGRQTCGADNTSTGAGVRELALAGARVAWIVNQGGNSESGDYLYTTVVAHPGERVLASAYRTGDVSGVLTGNWLGGLVGAGRFLAINHWATDSHERGHHCQPGARRRSRGRPLAGVATMTAQGDRWRQLAVLRSDGTVGIYSTPAQLRRNVVPSSAQEVALRGDYLVVLTKGSALEVSTRTPAGDCAHGGRPGPRSSTSVTAWPRTAPDAPCTSSGSRPARASSARALPRR